MSWAGCADGWSRQVEHGPVQFEKVVVLALEATVPALHLNSRVLHLNVGLHVELSEVGLLAERALVKPRLDCGWLPHNLLGWHQTIPLTRLLEVMGGCRFSGEGVLALSPWPPGC